MLFKREWVCFLLTYFYYEGGIGNLHDLILWIELDDIHENSKD